jgi:hypothetical protein
MQEHHKLFSDLFGKLERRMAEENNDLAAKITDTRGTHDEQLDELSTAVSQQGELLAESSAR